MPNLDTITLQFITQTVGLFKRNIGLLYLQQKKELRTIPQLLFLKYVDSTSTLHSNRTNVCSCHAVLCLVVMCSLYFVFFISLCLPTPPAWLYMFPMTMTWVIYISALQAAVVLLFRGVCHAISDVCDIGLCHTPLRFCRCFTCCFVL